MKILSSFTHSQVVPNLYECLYSAEDILKNVGTEQFWGTIDVHNNFFPTMEVNGAPKTACLQIFFKISSLVFGRTKKFIHGLELLEGE